MHPLFKKFLYAACFIALGTFTMRQLLYFQQGFFERTAAYLTYPFFSLGSAISNSIKQASTEKESYKILHMKYQKLQSDYLAAIDQIISLHATCHVHDNIKELLQFQERYTKPHGINAKVLTKTISAQEHSYLINRGSSDGVTVDSVALYQNHIIGRVTHVYGTYSKVLLITDRRCKVAAYSATTQASGIVQGSNTISCCDFTYVNHLFSINDNDLIISSGQGLVFPEGFCLGRIVVHALKPKDLYHYVQIEPMVNFEALQYCTIIDPATIKPL